MFNRKLFLVILVTLLMLGAISAAAEDIIATPTLTTEAVLSDVVVETPAPAETTIPDGYVVANVYVLIGGLIAAAAAGGGSVLVLAGRIAKRYQDNPREMKALEELAKSVPASVTVRILQFAEAMIPVGNVLVEAFDGIPAEGKPITTIAHDPTPTVVTSAYDAYDVTK